MKQLQRALHHPMWRAGCRCGALIGIIVGLCLPCVLHWVGQQHSIMVAAQWEADFGPSRRMAAEQAKTQADYEMAKGRHDAVYGQTPVADGKEPMALYPSDHPLGH